RIVVNIGLGNSFVETAMLKRDEASLEKNRNAVERLAENLAEAGYPPTMATNVPGGKLISKATVTVVDRFLAAFDNHPGSMLTDPEPIRRYIEDRNTGELAQWDILFASLKRAGSDTLVDTSLAVSINCQRRRAGDKSTTSTLRITN